MPRVPVELATAKEQGYYSIGRAAELSGVTPKMIRHYEALELIAKAARTMGDYRVYTAADIHTLRFVRRARALGFSMDEISTLLSLWRDLGGQVRRSSALRRSTLPNSIPRSKSSSPCALRLRNWRSTAMATGAPSVPSWMTWVVCRGLNEREGSIDAAS